MIMTMMIIIIMKSITIILNFSYYSKVIVIIIIKMINFEKLQSSFIINFNCHNKM